MEISEKKFLLLKLLIPLILVVILFAGAVSFGVITIGPEEKIIIDEQVSATIIIDFGDENVISHVISTKNNTVYDFLMEVAEIEDIEVKSTYYPQYDSYFIDSISNYAGAENSKNWMYYINGELGPVGADKQKVKDGDIIQWKYEDFTY
jgi:hypothetical protein